MATNWRYVNLEGDPNGPFLVGAFEDTDRAHHVAFTIGLWGGDPDVTVYELVDGEMGNSVKDVAEDVMKHYRNVARACRKDLSDSIADALARYEG